MWIECKEDALANKTKGIRFVWVPLTEVGKYLQFYPKQKIIDYPDGGAEFPRLFSGDFEYIWEYSKAFGYKVVGQTSKGIKLHDDQETQSIFAYINSINGNWVEACDPRIITNDGIVKEIIGSKSDVKGPYLYLFVYYDEETGEWGNELIDNRNG